VHLHLTGRHGFQAADGGRDITGQDGRVRPRGPVSVVDATYLGRLFSAAPIGLVIISGIEPQEPAKIS